MWIKSTDDLPMEMEWVLFWDDECCTTVPCIGYRDQRGDWHDQSNVDNCGNAIQMFKVTHWQRFEAPPKSDTAEEKQNDLTTKVKSSADATAEQICLDCKETSVLFGKMVSSGYKYCPYCGRKLLLT